MNICKHCGEEVWFDGSEESDWCHRDGYYYCNGGHSSNFAEPSADADKCPARTEPEQARVDLRKEGDEKCSQPTLTGTSNAPAVNQNSSGGGYNITCFHHNDSERLAVFNKTICPVCLHKEIEQLRAKVTELEAQGGVMRDALEAGQLIQFEGSPHQAIPIDLVDQAVSTTSGQGVMEQLNTAKEALKVYAQCSDGCTCGDGWDHSAAKEALEKIGGGK